MWVPGCQSAVIPATAIAPATASLPFPAARTRVAPSAAASQTPNRSTATPLPESIEELARSVYGERLIAWVDLPAISVRAPVRPVGWNAETEDSLPDWDNPEAEVGWVVSSALPGDTGNMILYGHNNIHSSVFMRLSEMQAGDSIILTTGEGEWRYRVREVVILEIGGEQANLSAYQEYLQPKNETVLTLLSCWPPDNNTHRVIVLAEPESEPANG